MAKILLVGPLSPPIHGQSLAFTRFIESISNSNKIIINTNLDDKSNLLKVILTFKTLILIIIKTLFCKYHTVYFTCSRSFLGSVKDVLLINLAYLKKVKIVNHLHGSDFYEFLHNAPKWYRPILLYSYSKVDTSIVLLDKMKTEFRDFKNMKVEVVPNFYDKELEVKCSKKETSKIKIVYLSNIIRSKGVFELIEAFEELSSKYDYIYLTIAGGFISDGDDIKDTFYNKISLNSHIHYVGKVFGKEKVELLQRSDIFVLPSYYKSEAFPISIIEAMVCENAIVTTNYKYLPDVVKNSNGILVEPKSIESLINGIESLLKNTKYNSQEAREKYSLDKYISNLNKIVMENK